jgi:hypothetical protein
LASASAQPPAPLKPAAKPRLTPFTTDDQKLARMLSDHAAIFIEQACGPRD